MTFLLKSKCALTDFYGLIQILTIMRTRDTSTDSEENAGISNNLSSAPQLRMGGLFLVEKKLRHGMSLFPVH